MYISVCEGKMGERKRDRDRETKTKRERERGSIGLCIMS